MTDGARPGIRRTGEDRVVTLPNALSVFRILLVPVFLILLVQGQDLLALATLAFSGVTDLLDGWIARRFDQMTKLGRQLDPAADRLYILAALIGLAARGLIPWWLLVVVFALSSCNSPSPLIQLKLRSLLSFPASLSQSIG